MALRTPQRRTGGNVGSLLTCVLISTHGTHGLTSVPGDATCKQYLPSPIPPLLASMAENQNRNFELGMPTRYQPSYKVRCRTTRAGRGERGGGSSTSPYSSFRCSWWLRFAVPALELLRYSDAPAHQDGLFDDIEKLEWSYIGFSWGKTNELNMGLIFFQGRFYCMLKHPGPLDFLPQLERI